MKVICLVLCKHERMGQEHRSNRILLYIHNIVYEYDILGFGDRRLK